MFYENGGWLHYKPFDTYRLPEIVVDPGETASFIRKEGKNRSSGFEKKLYKLQWPGKNESEFENIPTEFLEHWPYMNWPKCRNSSAYSLDYLLVTDSLPVERDMPENIAYHLAVNHDRLAVTHKRLFPGQKVKYAVAGLPAKDVQKVLDAQFALDGHAIAALKYLKWVAETHRPHPLLQGFDTMIREELSGLGEKATELYFYLLCDYLYDSGAKWYARIPNFHRLLRYFHYVGRTGRDRYRYVSGLGAVAVDGISKETLDGIQNWNPTGSRCYSHVTGKDPAVREPEEIGLREIETHE